ncbi:alpha/beta hydrolase fold domain-containing protein [Prosthecobacter sp.]|uniref:alpha/beta hydrolase fold domain-containing protein n=1 Tax=Prosthecobacter sp. TaxID=1965333 RepID=UPI0037843ABE
MRSLILAALSILLLVQCQKATSAPAGFKALRDLDYVGAGDKRQMLDLYLPEAKSEKPLPLIVYIHGGGWQAGSKDDATVLLGLIQGSPPYAGASLNYRLTSQAQWPAQIHDCKAAIRWLRGHAREYNLDPERISVFGISAGGHLVSMLGVTGGVKELEGELGRHLDQSSRVSCVLDFCGPSDFLTFGGKGSVIDPEDPNGPLARLIGGPLKDRREEARKASPVTYLTPDDAPFLIIHGDKDNIVPYAQATEFDTALKAAQIPSILLTGTDGGHVFLSERLLERMQAFNARHLRGKDVQIPVGAVPSK